jgi:16S rRNA (cytosine967-C5)-methyltransferase
MMSAVAATRAASPARLCAYRVIRRVTDGGAYADHALRAEASRSGISGRNRAFAQRLAYGTIQRVRTLDHVIGELSTRRLAAIDPPLRDALRLGVFQLAFMDGVAPHAAVSETVEIVKHERLAAGFANAVMRRAAREARGIVSNLRDDTPESAALRHSHPDWIVRAWWDALGRVRTLALLARDNEPPESAARANELVATRVEVRRALASAGVRTHAAQGLPEGFVLDGPFDVHGSALFEDGALMPQSRGSMLVARVVDPRPGERVLDMCAAPGAKATQLAALMRGAGEVIAVERRPARARALAGNCRRLAAANVRVLTADATVPVNPERFDRVLLDAPCSDLGTLQARPDARWRKSPERVAALSGTQRRLLEAAAAQVRPGGTLIYSTCTISPPENEQLVRSFLDTHTDFRADDLGARHPRVRSALDGRFLQLLPSRDLTDGFFIARLTRAAA